MFFLVVLTHTDEQHNNLLTMRELNYSDQCTPIILASNFTFNEHVSTLTSSLISTLCRISKVGIYFPNPYSSPFFTCLVFSKLFYCSTVWAGTFIHNIHKLQLVQNFPDHVLTNTRKFDHISPVLWELGWSSIKHLLLVLDVTQLSKIVNGLAPSYLNCYISKRTGIHI